MKDVKSWYFWVSKTLTVIIIFIAAFGIYNVYSAKQELKSNTAEYDNAVKESDNLTDVASKLKAKDTDTSVEKAQTTSVSAKKVGDAVASIQNEYPGADYNKVQKLNKKLSKYLNGSDANGWMPYENYETGSKPVWTFNTPYSYSSSSFKVIWLAKDSKTDDLLAYTTASYNSETNNFEDADVVMTGYGNNMLNTAVDGHVEANDQSLEDSKRYLDDLGGLN